MARDHRLLPCLAISCVSLLVVGSCGGGGQSGQQASRALRATTNAVRFTADQTVPGSRIAAAAVFFDEAVAQRQAIRGYLDTLANSPDPYGRLLTKALCTGMEQLAGRAEDEGGASDDEWGAFLVEQVAILAPNNPYEVISGKVDAFVTGAQLANIHPRAAQVYYQECIRRPR